MFRNKLIAIWTTGTLVLAATQAHATKITFDNAAANANEDIPLTYGSYVAANGVGFVTTDGSGATPNIGLSWVGNRPDEWEYHNAATWVHESPVGVAQIDFNRGKDYDDVAEVVFNPVNGRSVRINSFLLSGANDREDSATFHWEVVGTAVGGDVTVNLGENTGTIPVNFTGSPAASYTLRFTLLPGLNYYGTALDDLSFSEVVAANAPLLKLTVNRATGGLTLSNAGSTSVGIKGYTITSAAGALSQAGWRTIAGNYDVAGNGSVDPNDAWTRLTPAGTNYELSEYEFSGNGGSLAPAAAVALSPPAGGGWLKSPIQDLAMDVVLANGQTARYTAEYVNGPAAGFAAGDLNFDGTINPPDWVIYNGGRGMNLTGLSAVAAYQKGDLDGDFDNDVADFVAFKNLYVVANGAAAFAALGAVPEPAGAALVVVAAAAIFRRRLRVRPVVRRLASRSALLACVAVCLGFGGLGSRALATTITFGTTPNVPANNSDLAPTYGSNIAGTPTDTANGFVTTDGSGTTPNIALTWAPTGGTTPNGPDIDVLEYHSSTTFQGAGFTVPVLQFDVDLSQHSALPADPTVDFTVTGGKALKLNSFKIGNATDQTEPSYGWTINLIRLSDMTTVATRTTGLLGPGSLETVTFNYTGSLNTNYRLQFDDGGANAVRTAIDDLSFSETTMGVITPQLKLVVNRATGGVSLVNQSGQPFTIDSYEITSAGSSLSTTSWTSLQDQDYEGAGAPGSGNGWEEAGGVSSGHLIESFLLGNSTFANGASVSLGSPYAFGKLGVLQDLQFGYHVTGTGGFLTVGGVEYVGNPVDADFDNDNDVDGADLVIWQRNLGRVGSGTNALGDANGDANVNAADLAAWKSGFGSVLTPAAPVSGAVPEPATVGLFAAGMLGVIRRVRRASWRRLTSPRLQAGAVAAGLTIAASTVQAATTLDRYYRFGGHASETAVAGANLGASSGGVTVDSTSETGSAGDVDAQNLTPNSPSNGPKYANVSPSGLNRPGAGAGQFGAQFDGVDDLLFGTPLNRPDETVGPTSVGLGPLIGGYPRNYDQITARGIQLWVYPDAAAVGAIGRQTIVYDTQAAGGVSISADGKWSQIFDGVNNDNVISTPVAVVGNQWHHVMQHVYTTAPGAPYTISSQDRGFTSIVYVDGIAASANNGFPSPGELDNGDRVGQLVVGAEEVSGDGFTPAYDNNFKGVVDDLKMYVYGNNSAQPGPPAGQNYGTFSLLADNEWIVSQIALIPGGILKPGDVNRDGSLNQTDVNAFVAGWKKEKRLQGFLNSITVGDWQTWTWGDLNLDGIVDLKDAIILDHELNLIGAAGINFSQLGVGVPEPGSWIVAGTACAVAFCRRRRSAAVA
jgi:hypothetical protein